MAHQNIKHLPTMPTKCKTCPYRAENNATGIAASATSRALRDASQVCHSTGWPVGTHLCRGARDVQLYVFYRLGVIREATDEAWDEKRRELGC